jgi:hypothetical protein
MRLTRWIVDALSAVAALVFAYYGTVVVWTVFAFGHTMVSESSGGLGAVSGGMTDAFPIAMMATLALNLMLARFARRTGGLASKLHWAHSITLASILTCIVLVGLLLTISMMSGHLMAALFLLIGTLLGVQFWLLAVLLIAFIRRPAAPMAA